MEAVLEQRSGILQIQVLRRFGNRGKPPDTPGFGQQVEAAAHRLDSRPTHGCLAGLYRNLGTAPCSAWLRSLLSEHSRLERLPPAIPLKRDRPTGAPGLSGLSR